ncbi:Gastrula zinc finger protein XlCGF9.1, partial [Pseudolycoriella hygida]
MDYESQLTDMDDNDNLIDFQKMNFTPFTQFTGIPTNTLHQFTAAKFAQNITTADGQVVSLVSGADGGVQFLRQFDGGIHPSQQTNNNTSLQQAQTLILPITMPGDKPGDVQQTVQIQVLNPNQIQPSPKFQMSPMQIPIQGFQQPTVLTVAVPQDGELLSNHGLPEGVTVLAAIQPQDLQLFAAQTGQLQQQQQHQGTNENTQIDNGDSIENRDLNTITIKQEPQVWTNTIQTQPTDFSEYLSRQGIINLQQFLRFNPDTIKRESQIENSPLNGVEGSDNSQEKVDQGEAVEVDANGKMKKKRKYKKKPPKVKPPKPGQVHIATALDGTILFCCPECQMAYPDKTNLEQHLTVHKIERRYICDLCGAGLKRKEHLERHKLGHSPERPYICSVCMKGFKRKEHLNLHFVIHSGFKNEICGECGKGFYRKDHLRKHAKSHATKRLKEELNAQAAASSLSSTTVDATTQNSDNTTSSNDLLTPLPMQPESQTICLPNVTIHVPTSDNTTLPVQIQLPQLVTTSSPDGTTSTVVLQSPIQESLASQNQNQSIDQQIQQQIQQQFQQQLQQQQQQIVD